MPHSESARTRPELLVACSVVLATFGQVGLKLSLSSTNSLWTRAFLSILRPLTVGLLLSLLLYVAGTLLWVLAVSRKEISYLYPLASANYILVALAGHLILNEPLLPGRWLGIGVMVVGIVLLTYRPSKHREEALCS